MSFWDKAAKAASDAAEATKRAAAAAAESAKKTYADLRAAPSIVLCPKCNVDVQVPGAVWDWQCENKHSNPRDLLECSECKAARPKELANPQVTCAACSTVITVPSSNLTKHVKEGGQKTATFVKTTAANTKAYIEHQAAAPDTFHCAHCDALLAVPTGPWACQTCTNTNGEEIKICAKCSQKKSDQKAICGVCGQSTKIPTSNFIDSVKHTARDVSLSSKKLYYDVAGKAYTTCPRCNTHIKIDAPPKPAAAAAAAAAGSAAASEAQKPGVVAGDASAAAAVPASGEGAAVNEDVSSTDKEIVCPNCKNKFDRH